MQFEKGFIYHIYNEGNNQQNIFFNRENYFYFLRKLKTFIIPYADILAWCLIPNRFHLMIQLKEIELPVQTESERVIANHPLTPKIRTLNDSIAIMLRSYTRGVNKQQNRSGALFRESTQAECLNCPQTEKLSFITPDMLTNDESGQYPYLCLKYIHRVPVRASLVKNIVDWEFSSAQDYAGLRKGTLVNTKTIKQLLQKTKSPKKYKEEYTLKDIAQIAGGKLQNSAGDSKSPAESIHSIIIDSRSLLLQKNTLFIALKTQRNDGHYYIKDLYQKGVRNFLVEYLPENIDAMPEANFILVKNTLTALQDFAAHHRQQFDYPVLGITGSNGKTIIKEWIFELLSHQKRIIRSPKSYNSQIGVPLSVLLMKKNYDLAIFEAGISQKQEMRQLEKIILPDIGIFTNIGDAHQENFDHIDEKINEKLSLFKNSKLLIYCKDHSLIRKAIKKSINPQKTKLFTWSIKQKADLSIKKIIKKQQSTQITFVYEKHTSAINLPYTDNASIENALHVLAFIISQNLFNQDTASAFNKLSPVAMRLELVEGINQCTLINDTYNSDLNSIQIALDVLMRQNKHKQKSLIISDVLQSGQNEKELYEKLAQMINKVPLHRIILVGEKLHRHRNLFKGNIQNFMDTEAFLQSKMHKNFQNEIILLKAARKFRFDRINEIMQRKNHRTVLEINMENMKHNLNYYRSLVNKNTKIMVMVKAFSYGSGSFEIASWLEQQKIDYLGVAYVDEGVELRKSGISLPIMVMNPNFESFRQLIEYKLEPEIYSFSSLHEFSKAAEKYSVYPYPIHLKIDTGMRRLGFEPKEIKKLTAKLTQYHSIKVKSVFSHLVASDEPEQDAFTKKQINDFEKVCRKIKNALGYPFYRHILNSSGIERFPHARFDMVRLGIGLYGISPNNQDKLKNVSTLKTHISQIKKVKAGETVGYSRAGKIKTDTQIAVLPIGYADGLNRKLSNGNGQVLLKDRFVPFIGNICMDMSMIDIGKIPASEDDEVIIFGENLPVGQLAKTIETIPYEIFTSVSSRVKRVYLY